MRHHPKFAGYVLSIMSLAISANAADLSVVSLHQLPAELPTPEKIIVRALLEEMGLNYPSGLPEPAPAPVPAPEPAPTPAPEPGPVPGPKPVPKPNPPTPPARADDFFSDDDFFDKEGTADEVAAGFDNEFKRIRQSWDKQYQDTLAKWDTERKTFLAFRKHYAEQTAAFGVQNLKTSTKLQSSIPLNVSLDISQMADGDFHVIPASLSLKIKDQRERGTCTAFASVRAIETLMGENGYPIDLSEQYFYWLSKPECQFSACNIATSSEGTNPVRSLEIANRAKPLPPENLCPYQPTRNKENITFAPLNSCDSVSDDARAARPINFSVIDNTDTLARNILGNRPVLIGTTLSQGFMNPKIGLVRTTGAVLDTDKQGHAGGHAMLVVGLIKLPKSLQMSEGRYCAITANSWGEGWGKGGYVCLTERWMTRFSMMFVAIESVQVSDRFVKRQ